MLAKQKKRYKFLQEQLFKTKKALQALEKSTQRAKIVYSKKQKIPVDTQDEILEALTSRFARVADLMTQRLFRAVDAIELVDEGALPDLLNRMEKRRVITDADEWIFIRELRNDIAHDYLYESNKKIRKEAYQLAPILQSTYENLLRYLEKKHKLSSLKLST